MSCFERIDAGGLTKAVIAPEARSRAPMCLLGAQSLDQFWIDRHWEAQSEIPPLGAYCFANGLAGAAGLVFTPDRKVVDGTDILVSQWLKDRIEESIATREEHSAIYRAYRGGGTIVPVRGAVVHVVKPGWQVYGHWLVDILPTLWMYRRLQAERPSLCSGAKILLPHGVPSWAMAMAEAAVGLREDECIFFDEQQDLIKPETLIVPSLLRIENGFSTLLDAMIDDIVGRHGHARADHPRRLFVYRGNRYSFMQRQIPNEDELARAAEAVGFATIDPAKLPWPEQVALFAGAEAVIGPFGSGMHNMLFSPSKTLGIVLTNSSMNWIQSGISALRQQTMAYLWPEREEHGSDQQTFHYNIDAFKRSLDEIETHLASQTAETEPAPSS